MVNFPQGRVNPVRYFFDVIAQEENRVTKRCKLCGRNYRASLGISSNFISHLKSAHKVEFAEFQRQFVLSQYPNTPQGPCTPQQQFRGEGSAGSSSGPSTSPGQFGGVSQECLSQPYQMFFQQYNGARATPETPGATCDVKVETIEMDLPYSEESEWRDAKTPRLENTTPSDVSTKEGNDTLNFQLEAYKNEIRIIKHEMKAQIENKEKQLLLLQQTLQSLQNQMADMAKEKSANQNGAVPSTCTEVALFSKSGIDSDRNFSPDLTTGPAPVPEKEAKLIGVLTTFLHIHPMGAGVDYITSYVQRVVERTISHSEVDQVLNRYPTMFRQSVTGVGANMERKWVSTVFENCQL